MQEIGNNIEILFGNWDSRAGFAEHLFGFYGVEEASGSVDFSMI